MLVWHIRCCTPQCYPPCNPSITDLFRIFEALLVQELNSLMWSCFGKSL